MLVPPFVTMFIIEFAAAIGSFLLVRRTLSPHFGWALTLQIVGFSSLTLASLHVLTKQSLPA